MVKKTAHRLSVIDQGYEQSNAAMKDDGAWAVGLTENLAALRRWMVSVLEMATVIGKLEALIEKRKKLDPPHHEEAKHV